MLRKHSEHEEGAPAGKKKQVWSQKWALWCDSMKTRQTSGESTKALWLSLGAGESRLWLVWVGRRENQSAFKCICGEEETLKCSSAPSTSFVLKPPIPCPIWMSCGAEFWWRKGKNSPLPDFPSPSLSPSIVTGLWRSLMTTPQGTDYFQVFVVWDR